MIEKSVRIGSVEEQDTFRREDVLRMTPAARLQCLIHLRNQHVSANFIPIRESKMVKVGRQPSAAEGRL